jgi:FtsH-binding integral membrane protein
MINGSGYGYGNRGNRPYYATVSNSVSDANALLSRVSYLLCTALLVTAGGCYLGRGMSPAFFLPLAIGTFACAFGVNFARNNPALGLGLLYLLSLLEGLLLAPFIAMIGHTPAGASMVEAAFGITAVLMVGLGSYVWISGADFRGLGKFLMYGIIGLILVGILSFFVGHLMSNPQFNLLYSLFGVALFIGFALYDFSNIKLRYGPNDYVIAAVQLYLDFLNLFLFILRLLMMFGGGGSNRR